MRSEADGGCATVDAATAVAGSGATTDAAASIAGAHHFIHCPRPKVSGVYAPSGTATLGRAAQNGEQRLLFVDGRATPGVAFVG